MNNEKNRQLTPDEAKRNEAYEKDKARLEQEGYKVYDLTTSVVKSNVMAVVLVIPFAVIFTLLYFIVHKPPFWEFISDTIDYGSLWGLLLYFAVIFVLMIVHELIHGVTRALFAKSGWKAVSFGFVAKYLTPYCTCSEPLTKVGYITGALMPAIILGIIPIIVSIAIGNATLFGISFLMILAGGGDIHTSLKLMTFKTNGKKSIYIDHPYLVGLTAFVKE